MDAKITKKQVKMWHEPCIGLDPYGVKPKAIQTLAMVFSRSVGQSEKRGIGLNATTIHASSRVGPRA